jgi:hypothetical protein
MLPTEPIISSSYLNAPDVMPKVRRSSQHARADLFKVRRGAATASRAIKAPEGRPMFALGHKPTFAAAY